MTSATIIYTVGSGVTDREFHDKYRFWDRQTHDPLHPEILNKLAYVADMLATKSIGALYSAPEPPAVKTAKYISNGLSCPIIISPALVQQDFGSWAGMEFNALQREYPEECYKLKMRPDIFRIGGGENLNAVYTRVSTFVDELCKKHKQQRIVLVSHAPVLQAFMAGVLGIPMRNAAQLDIDGGTYGVVKYAAGRYMLCAANQGYSFEKEIRGESQLGD